MKLFSIISFLYLTNHVFISGHLKNNANPSVGVTHQQILLMYHNKLVAKTLTQKDGSYELSFLDVYDTDTLTFYMIDSKNIKDTLFLKNISDLNTDIPVIDLVIAGKPHKKNKK